MKKLISILTITFVFASQQPASAQSKQKAEKEFLGLLNSILIHSKQQHWAFEGAMTIDSAFAITREGILSVTVSYTTDSGIVRCRLEAPVNKMVKVSYDLFIILECKDRSVTFYQSEPGSNELKEAGKTDLFHVGAPVAGGMVYQKNLQKALERLLGR